MAKAKDTPETGHAVDNDPETMPFEELARVYKAACKAGNVVEATRLRPIVERRQILPEGEAKAAQQLEIAKNAHDRALAEKGGAQ
jgi:hypothetical protein